jgi:LmbE family N-acetylglucosaminyl deacetylase
MRKNALVVVAHPDDEVLWAGGTILNHPSFKWFIVCLTRRDDKDRAPRFYQALKALNATGVIGSLDDGPEQKPLKKEEVAKAIIDFLPSDSFDIVISHSPLGEYTSHLRHEEIGNCMIQLWCSGRVKALEYWAFAYEDGCKKYLPRAIKEANLVVPLSEEIWQKKYQIISGIYGFAADSWEARTVPDLESFWQFSDVLKANEWLKRCTGAKFVSGC